MDIDFLAGHTSRITLLAWVTAVTYREPGLLAKAVTTLDVLSGGRAWLGIGAGFYEAETSGLGLPLPPVGGRFERLEEALQICLQMWSGSDAPYEGSHYRLARTLNSPQPLTRTYPPILVAGGGEKKTLRLVAKYAHACNVGATPELEHKLAVLRQHCEEVGRDYDDITKTVITRLDPWTARRASRPGPGTARLACHSASPTSRPRSPASRTLHRWRCSQSASSRPQRNSNPCPLMMHVRFIQASAGLARRSLPTGH